MKRIQENSVNVKIDGHVGSWYVIGKEKITKLDETGSKKSKVLFLLEHETYGEEAAGLIVDRTGKIYLDDVYNGFEELDIFEYWKDFLNNKEVFVMTMEKKMPELFPERYFEGVYYYKFPNINGQYLAICDKYWNGEKYDAWMVDEKLFHLSDVRARPIYRREVEDIDFLDLEEGSEEWDKAMELVDFDLYPQ